MAPNEIRIRREPSVILMTLPSCSVLKSRHYIMPSNHALKSCPQIIPSSALEYLQCSGGMRGIIRNDDIWCPIQQFQQLFATRHVAAYYRIYKLSQTSFRVLLTFCGAGGYPQSESNVSTARWFVHHIPNLKSHDLYYRTLHLSLRNTQTVPAEGLKKWEGGDT